MRHALSVLTASALALAGCATDTDTNPDPAPDVTATATPDVGPTNATPTAAPTTAAPSPTTAADGVAALEFTTCEADAYTVGHPADWERNDPEAIADACRVFHPGPVDLPDQPQDRDLHWAVSIGIDAAAYEDVTSADPQGEVLEQRDTTVAGRDARVTEVRSDGAALVPEGEVSYGYVVDLDDRVLLAHTYSVGDTDYERDKRVLDRMMAELEFTSDG